MLNSNLHEIEDVAHSENSAVMVNCTKKLREKIEFLMDTLWECSSEVLDNGAFIFPDGDKWESPKAEAARKPTYWRLIGNDWVLVGGYFGGTGKVRLSKKPDLGQFHVLATVDGESKSTYCDDVNTAKNWVEGHLGREFQDWHIINGRAM